LKRVYTTLAFGGLLLGGAVVAAPHVPAAASSRPIKADSGPTATENSAAKTAPVTCHTAKLAAGADPVLTKFDSKQLGYVVTIYNTGRHLGLPQRAAVVAIATALQESYLRNLANRNVPASLDLPNDGTGQDHDSVGLFQQRPLPPWGAGGWGTPKELMTPQVSATKFYRALAAIPGWQHLPLTVAAQSVQRSAFPNAYARHEPTATTMVSALDSGVIACSD
jgi:hypothetical protein